MGKSARPAHGLLIIAMRNKQHKLRQAVLDASHQLIASGLNLGTAGNVSVRVDRGFLITPSGVAVDAMTTDSLVFLQMNGEWQGDLKPSSEWRFHRDLYLNRADCMAVVHTHSVYATALSTLRRDLPAFHYMIAVAGGDSIRCAPYALFGTQALSDHVISAIQGRTACLMANHGMISIGENLDKALYVTQEIEQLCQQYLVALQVGEPVILSADEMQAVMEQFKGYGALSK